MSGGVLNNAKAPVAVDRVHLFINTGLQSHDNNV
jgi:hypothetical protein